MRNDLCIVLTARMGSERLPGKAMANIDGQPLLYWILQRLKLAGNVVLGITKNTEDDPLAGLARAMQIPFVRWQSGDVIGTIEAGWRTYYPNSKYILRGLGDMPWLATEIVERAVQIMAKTNSDAFVWSTPNVYPCYGAREFPYSLNGWQTIYNNSIQREHADQWFHEHRNSFKIVRHAPPDNVYYRNYRLEVDYPEDLQMVREVAKHMSMLAPFTSIIKFLDQHDGIAHINHERVERTGPSLFDYKLQRNLVDQMRDQPIMDWTNHWWPLPPSGKSVPIYCKSGQCLLGLADQGILFAKSGRFKSGAYLTCNCGAGLLWS